LWLITTLHVVTLTLHFVAMNFLFGGLIILVFGRLTNKWDDPTVKTFLKFFPTAMAATVTFGVAPLLFVQLVYYRQIYSASITSGWLWLLIVPAVIIAYYLLYAAAFRCEKGTERLPMYLTLAGIMLVYVSFVYSTVFSMGERPGLYETLYASNQSGWVINSEPGGWFVRWLHMVLGAVTIGGFFVGILGRDNAPAFAVGKRFYLWGMIGSMIVGVVYILTLGDFLGPYMQSSGIWLVAIAFVLSLLSLHWFFKRRFVGSGLLLFLSMAAMVANRHTLRLVFLDGKFDPGTIRVASQWSVFLVFLVFFVIAIGLAAYMIKTYFGSQEEGT
jgi:hypothetical protein